MSCSDRFSRVRSSISLIVGVIKGGEDVDDIVDELDEGGLFMMGLFGVLAGNGT